MTLSHPSDATLPRVGSSQDQITALELRELSNQLFNPVFSVLTGDVTVLPLIFLAEGVVLVQTPGAVRAGSLVRTIDTLE